MVERYWGVRRVFAEDFAPLLNAHRDGIETGALARAMADRGWRTLSVDASLETLSHHLHQGRPVIALIAAGVRRYHYVVVVAAGAHVVFHDPAVRPHQRLDAREFDRRWAATNRWSLLVLPSTSPAPPHDPERAAHIEAPRVCQPWVTEAIRLAGAGELGRAETFLGRARAECPESSAPWRELAAIRLLERRHGEAVPLAETAVSREPRDLHAWRVLGAARFLDRNDLDALAAWNRVGEPAIDLVRIEGLIGTRHRVVLDRMSIAPRSLLTPGDLTRARRRLESLPTLSSTRVEVVPAGSGLADLRAAVVERPLLARAPAAIAAAAARAAIDRELTVQISSPSGSGERLDLMARWWDARPSGAVTLHVPVRTAWVSGILRVAGQVQRETFATPDPAAAALSEDHRGAAIALSDWASGNLRWEGELRLDRWTGIAPAIGVGGSLERRVTRHAALRGAVHAWPAPGITAVDVGARWRWRPTDIDRLLTSFNASLATRNAPRALWPGAGVGHGRPLLLRAHPLLDDGVVQFEGVGRRLLHGSAEARHPILRNGLLPVSVAAFADAAVVARGDASAFRHLDVGLGARIGFAGEGVVRVDYARGLADGAHAVSVGWELPWPAWP
jgi:hypothetical protein